MSRRAQENVIALLILGVFIAAIWAATGYGPRARLVPIPIAALGGLMILAQLILQNFRSEKDLEIDLLDFISRKATDADLPVAAQETETEEPAENIEAEKQRFGREAMALGVVLLLIGLFFTIGPLPAMFIFTSGYFVLSRHANLPMGILYGLFATACVYALFHLWLGVDMRQGYFELTFGLW